MYSNISFGKGPGLTGIFVFDITVRSEYLGYRCNVKGLITSIDLESIDGAPISEEKTIGRIRTFVNVESFDYTGLEAEVDVLEAELRDISQILEKTPEAQSLVDQVKFAQPMLQVMKRAITYMHCYGNMEAPGARVLYKMVELNVRILAMYNVFGALDMTINGYAGKLTNLRALLKFYENKFEGLADVPLAIRIMFLDQTWRADQKLSFLEQKPVEESESVSAEIPERIPLPIWFLVNANY
ncbi:hypothetical protein JCM33374_g6187 [Metschnikowia sp. JCM 33374]|nr:hypothetical protein JCM33374_g6187 [Metschnikowia sp. JCM 33374]